MISLPPLRTALLLGTLLLAAAARAQVAFESFSYTTGGLIGSTNTNGFASAWTAVSGSYSVVGGNLTANGLTASGNSASGTGNYTRTLSSTLTGDVWISAVIKITAPAGTLTDYAGIYFGSGSGAMFMGANGNASEIGIATKSTAAGEYGLDGSTAVNFTTGASNLLVLRLDLTNGNYYFYFNPTNSTNPGTPTHGAGGKAFGNIGTADTIGIYSGGMTLGVDEIRIGSTYSSVVPGLAVPEPGTWSAFAGTAVLGLALWRKRRRAAAAETRS